MVTPATGDARLLQRIGADQRRVIGLVKERGGVHPGAVLRYRAAAGLRDDRGGHGGDRRQLIGADERRRRDGTRGRSHGGGRVTQQTADQSGCPDGFVRENVHALHRGEQRRLRGIETRRYRVDDCQVVLDRRTHGGHVFARATHVNRLHDEAGCAGRVRGESRCARQGDRSEGDAGGEQKCTWCSPAHDVSPASPIHDSSDCDALHPGLAGRAVERPSPVRRRFATCVS